MSIVKVAELAGVSKSTVSRVINEKSNVSPEAVRLVQAAIGQLDYRPRLLRPRRRRARLKPGDPLPTEMHLVKTFQIARSTVRQAMAELERVQPALSGNEGVSDFVLVAPETRGAYSSLLYGFELAASQVHNNATICCTDNDVNKQGNLILKLLRKKVAGVAIVPAVTPPTPAYQILELQERGIPVVFCHRRVEGVRAPLLAIPFEQVGRLAGEAFVRQGHRRAAYFSNMHGKVAQANEDCLRETMRSVGGDLPKQFVYIGQMTSIDITLQEEAVLEALRRMCGHPDPPTAIYTSSDELAELVYLLLGRLGRRVPDDISLMGFGDIHREGAMLSRITSVVIDEANIGRRAVELLSQMCTGKRPLDDEETTFVPLSLSEGRTLGPAPRLVQEAACAT